MAGSNSNSNSSGAGAAALCSEEHHPYFIECAFLYSRTVFWLPVPAAGLLAKHVSRALKERLGMNDKLCDARGKPTPEDKEDLLVLRVEPALTPYGGNEWVRPGTAVRLCRRRRLFGDDGRNSRGFSAATTSAADGWPKPVKRAAPHLRNLWRDLFHAASSQQPPSSSGSLSGSSSIGGSSLSGSPSPPASPSAFSRAPLAVSSPSAASELSVCLADEPSPVSPVPWLGVTDHVVNVYLEATCLNHRQGYAALLHEVPASRLPPVRRLLRVPNATSAAEVELRACAAALELVQAVLPAYPSLRYVRVYVMSTCVVLLLNKYVVPSVTSGVSVHFQGSTPVSSAAQAVSAAVQALSAQCRVMAHWDSYGHRQDTSNTLRLWLAEQVRLSSNSGV